MSSRPKRRRPPAIATHSGRFHIQRTMTKNSRVSTNIAPVTAMP